MIHLEVQGKPIAQPRQRHRIVAGKNGKMFVQNYTPATGPAASWKRQIARAAREAFQAPWDGAVSLRVGFSFQVKSKPQHFRTKKPDLDNMVKLVCDAMNGIAYHDDSQIARMTLWKCDSVEWCGVMIWVERLEE